MFDWLGGLISGIGDGIASGLNAVWETISNSIWDVFLKWIYKAIYDSLADFFTMISNMGAGLFDLEWVNATIKLFSLFGWSLFVVGLVVCIFDVAMEQQSGRVNIKTTGINVLKGFFAVSLFTLLPIELYKFCITLQNLLSKDLSTIFAGQAEGSFGIAGAANSALTMMSGIPSVFNLFAMIALGYCVIKIFFANIKRGGILMIQIAVGSLYMFSIPRGYSDGFTQWVKQVIALCLTAFLQTTLLFLGLLTWQKDWLLAIGIMMAANEVPRIAQTFGLDTSVKVNMMSAVHTTTTAVNLSKSLIGK
ncbi:MAG: DUF6045 family protein [Oscillospiraceae bacterium]